MAEKEEGESRTPRLDRALHRLRDPAFSTLATDTALLSPIHHIDLPFTVYILSVTRRCPRSFADLLKFPLDVE